MMQLQTHSARDYADALKALLPPGAAFDWPEGGVGDALLLGTAQELARVDGECQSVTDSAVTRHQPLYRTWTLADYQDQIDSALGAGVAVIDDSPEPTVAGHRIGRRTWSERSRYLLRVRYSGGTSVLAALQAVLDPFKQAHVAVLYLEI